VSLAISFIRKYLRARLPRESLTMRSAAGTKRSRTGIATEEDIMYDRSRRFPRLILPHANNFATAWEFEPAVGYSFDDHVIA
jgi:hypothetical protein